MKKLKPRDRAPRRLKWIPRQPTDAKRRRTPKWRKEPLDVSDVGFVDCQ